MKILQKTVLALVAGSLMTAGAQAAINYGNGMTAQPYVGAKVGQYDLDSKDTDNATSYGIYGGAKFTPNFGAELEYMTTSDAKADSTVKKGMTIDGEYSADIYGLYGTYEYPITNTPIYAKGRLGFAKNSIDLEMTNASNKARVSKEYSDSGIAGGLGLGYNLTPNAVVEVAYDWYPSVDVNGTGFDANGITLGANFKF